MDCSIIIINKNDEGIKETLQALEKIKKPAKTEIIVVDFSQHKLDWIKEKFKEIQWIYFSPKRKKVSIPEQRNIGLKAAKGKVIVFTDASCVPVKKTWLMDLIAPITKEKESFVRGAVTDNNFVTVHKKEQSKVYVEECPTINMAITKKLIDTVGLFDESFSYGSDMDFSWRAIKAGFKIRYIEEAAVTHDFGDTEQNMRRYFYYGEARGRLYLKHPDKLHLIKNYELKSAVYFFVITLFPLAFHSRIYLIILAMLLILPLPRNPFKEIAERYVFTYGLLRGILNLTTEKARELAKR